MNPSEIQKSVVEAMRQVKTLSKGRYYPAWFAYPQSKVRRPEGGTKTKELATVIPGDVSTYIFKKEEDYLGDYGTSRFGWTWKKGGWDCMRHLEILASGCVPLFKGMDLCPPAIMVGYPKCLLSQIYSAWVEAKGEIDSKTYDGWREALDKQFYASLTCGAMVRMSHACVFGFEAKPPTKVLFLDDRIPTKPDYLSTMVLIGLYEAWPSATIHVPFGVPYLYGDAEGDLTSLYGRGFSYVRSIDPGRRVPSPTLPEAIKDFKSYDLIVYGSVKRSRPGLYSILGKYPKDRTWFFCGADVQPHISRIQPWSAWGTLFMREARPDKLPK